MGILKDAIKKAAADMGVEFEWLNTPPEVIETEAQAKYNDIRRVESNYTNGVHNANNQLNDNDND